MSDRTLRAAILVLTAVGAVVAAYLTVAHLLHVQVACATSGCERVQTSRYAEVAGIPVAAGGLACYVLIAGSAVGRGPLVRAVSFFATMTGFAVSMVLLYVQAAVLHAYCQWCLTSDAIFVLLLPVTALRAWRATPPGGGSSRRAPRLSARAPRPRAGRPRPRRSAG